MKTLRFLPSSIALEDKVQTKIISTLIDEVFGDCNGYYGYKLTTLGRDSDDETPTFILLTKEYGITLIDVLEDKITAANYDTDLDIWELSDGGKLVSRDYFLDVFTDEINSRLKNEPSFYSRKKRQVTVPTQSVLIFPLNSEEELNQIIDQDDLFSTAISNSQLRQDFIDYRSSLESFDCNDDVFDKIVSLIEGTYVFENKYKIKEDKELVTVSDFIEESLHRTFKQDEAQRIISMQIPDGPQRIRGLAGTGKTIVLSLKAAITHKRMKDHKILYLFNTQSLYGIITQHISKYFVAEAKKAPDFENKLNIFHAWGGRSKQGLYSTLCSQLGISPKTYGEVKGHTDPLEYIFRDLLDKAGHLLEPMYDMVLIDEAQDFPPAIFETVYKITKDPKRIVWAYDDFQSLRHMKIKEPETLFGLNNETGLPNITQESLTGQYLGGIDKDFVLPNCYRTPRPVLMTAHAVAMGLYNKDKIMQPFDNKADWNAIGYSLVSPDKDVLVEGDAVELTRPEENSKNKLESLICANDYKATDLVNCVKQKTIGEELEYVSFKIHELITKQNVPPEEIIVVNLNNRTGAKEQLAELRIKLNQRNIRCVSPGFVESADIFRVPGSVTLATPFRAKGNESNIVFVFNSQKVVQDSSLRARNAFFASLTRSRGWCYITGHSDSMDALTHEIEQIKSDFPSFKFVRPSDDKIAYVRQLIHTSSKELSAIEKSLEKLKTNPELLLQEIRNNPELASYISKGLGNE